MNNTSGSNPSNSKKGESRRDALKKLGGLGATGLLGGLGSGCAAASQAGETASAAGSGDAQQRPNIVFIMTDDHTIRTMSAYGDRRMETPNLDRIAEEGMRFDDACVTNSLCAPSRAAILTGKYSHKNGVMENLYGDKEPFDGSQQTFPKLLREAGYRTALLGKWHLKSDPTGFDYWNRLPGQGRYNNPRFLEGDIDGQTGEHEYEGYVTDIITDMTIDKMEEYKETDEPFCVFSWHKAPHRGWIPDEEHADLFEGYDLPVPGTFNDDYMNRSSAAAHADMRIADMPDWSEWRDVQPDGLTEQEKKHWNYQKYIKSYLGTIASVDENVGRLLDYLDEAGLAEDTIVVYTSDQGMFIGEHGWYDKRFMYEESLRIPLVVRYPREVPAGSVNGNVVMNIDFAETFLDYADAEIPDDMQGRSLRPLLRGEQVDDWRDTVYYHYYEYPGPHDVRPHYGVRSERYKLIYFYTIDEWELFDLEKDPNEMQNQYHAPAYQDVVQEMTAELRRQRRHYEDTTGEPIPG